MIPNIAVILTDAQRKIQWVNEDFTNITGYALGEVIGKKPSILQGVDSDPCVITRIRKGLDQQVPIKEKVINYRKSGEAYTCILIIHPVFDQQQKLTNFIAFEIDGNKDSEELVPLMQLSEKYRTSSLKGADEQRLFRRLQNAMEQEHLYLDPDLTLREVAEKLSTNTKYLSQVVNNQLGINFQQFVNNYRINKVKENILTKEFKHLTLFGIARLCGFKNKSTFYKVFKEITGITPRAYMKKPQESNSFKGIVFEKG